MCMCVPSLYFFVLRNQISIEIIGLQMKRIWNNIRKCWSILKNEAERDIFRQYSATGELCTKLLLRMKIIKKRKKRSPSSHQPSTYHLHTNSIRISFYYTTLYLQLIIARTRRVGFEDTTSKARELIFHFRT